MYGVAECIRSDNGPEFIAKAIHHWFSSLEVKTLYMERVKPWQNGYAAGSHSRLRDELLNSEESNSMRHTRANAAARREDYIDYRPRSSLGGLPSHDFARRCADSAPFAAQTPLQQHSETQSITQSVFS